MRGPTRRDKVSLAVLGLAVAIGLAAPSGAAARPHGTARGEASTRVDLLRLREGGTKVYVRATLPDGAPGLFMVDTGAQMSVLNPSAAARLGVVPRGTQEIVGVTGPATVQMGDLPWVRLGDVVVSHVEIAIGAPGQPEVVSGVPIDGILGNNVWSHFVLDLDYRADTLTLRRAGTWRLRGRSAPMHFDGAHLQAPVQFVSAGPDGAMGASWVALDTGAHDLLFRGARGLEFDGAYTEGLEPIFGVTSTDGLPMSAYLRPTRRVAVDRVVLGGRVLDVSLDAVWMAWDDDSDDRSWRGLAGHELFDGRRLILDYQGGRYAIRPSRSRPDFHDARRLTLEDELAQHGQAPDRALVRAGLHLALAQPEDALRDLHGLLRSGSPTLDGARRAARILAARLHRLRGEHDEARQLLSALGPEELVAEGELVGVVNSLLLEGEGSRARELAAEALARTPDAHDAWLAWSDVQLAEGALEAARDALVRATGLARDPGAHALRRARVALAARDHDAALAILRDGVQLNPLDGQLLWFYARVAEAEDRDTLRSDLVDLLGRVHPRMLPHDFVVGAFTTLGDGERALTHMRAGIARDCERPDAAPAARDNCVAWYHTLARHDLDAALDRVDTALAAEGSRPDFLDTKAMVHLARGELAEARRAAIAAARMSPEDPYMLWQADWIRALLAAPTAQAAAR